MATTDVETGPAAGTANVADFKEQSARRKSLKVQLQDSKAESKNPINFVIACCCIISGSVGFTILLGIFLALPIASISIGAVYLNDCKIQRYIPIYLIVGGCFGVASIIARMIRRACFPPPEGEEGKVGVKDVKSNLLETIFSLFIFAWFIAGSVWIFGCYQDVIVDETWKELPQYCNKVLYYYSFWITIASWITVALCCCCCCCAGIVSSFK